MIKFKEWLQLREQMTVPGQKPTNPIAPKNDSSKIDARIKQTMAANIKKPKNMQKSALENLGKQIATDPSTTPKDLKKLSDVISDDEG